MSTKPKKIIEEDYYRPPKYPLIYTVHGMRDLETGTESRNFGWFETFKKAKIAVLKDGGILHEECYDYIVVEGYPSGIERIPRRENEHWYRWHFKKQKYLPIDKPAELKNIVSFAL